MEILLQIAELFLNLDQSIEIFIKAHGSWIYLLLFLIVFCETGLVVTPFLPGDSLLLIVGTFCGVGHLELAQTLLILIAAAVLGDAFNYRIGKIVGLKILNGRGRKFIKKEHIETTEAYYKKYGGRTIIIARYIPIIRTFAPFVAGISRMNYLKFFVYNFTGGALWVSSLVLAGYFFGNVPLVKEHFSFIVLGVILISLVPVFLEFRRKSSA